MISESKIKEAAVTNTSELTRKAITLNGFHGIQPGFFWLNVEIFVIFSRNQYSSLSEIAHFKL